MNIDSWLQQLTKINNKINSNILFNFITYVPYKYLLCELLELPNNITKILNKKEREIIVIWDCEFQNYILRKGQLKYTSSNNENVNMISELGLLLLLKGRDNTIYLISILHCSLINQTKYNINEMFPIYHEYMSITANSLNKIIKLENKIYLHLQFMTEWEIFKERKDVVRFNNKMIEMCDNRMFKKTKYKYIIQKVSSKLLELIDLLENKHVSIYDILIEQLIIKIHKILKEILYMMPINKYPKTQQKLFYKIMQIYKTDVNIQKILIPTTQHNIFIEKFNDFIYNSNVINIVKGIADIQAVHNCNILFNEVEKRFILPKMIIDISMYNEEIYKMCSSAKLYESYTCLMNRNKDNYNTAYHTTILNNIYKYYNKELLKAHNPLMDAFYTIIVFIQYNNVLL